MTKAPKSTKTIFLEPPTARKPQKPSSSVPITERSLDKTVALTARLMLDSRSQNPAWPASLHSLEIKLAVYASHIPVTVCFPLFGLGEKGGDLCHSHVAGNVGHIDGQRLLGVGSWSSTTPHWNVQSQESCVEESWFGRGCMSDSNWMTSIPMKVSGGSPSIDIYKCEQGTSREQGVALWSVCLDVATGTSSISRTWARTRIPCSQYRNACPFLWKKAMHITQSGTCRLIWLCRYANQRHVSLCFIDFHGDQHVSLHNRMIKFHQIPLLHLDFCLGFGLCLRRSCLHLAG